MFGNVVVCTDCGMYWNIGVAMVHLCTYGQLWVSARRRDTTRLAVLDS